LDVVVGHDGFDIAYGVDKVDSEAEYYSEQSGEDEYEGHA
jgi:hypothetical protein